MTHGIRPGAASYKTLAHLWERRPRRDFLACASAPYRAEGGPPTTALGL